MSEHHITVSRSARYYLDGELGPDTRRLWLVAHGYGQLAAYFIRHFAFLAADDPATAVVAPEGLSRFYLHGSSGRVGASWMTRDDRLAEIEDHTALLNQLTAKLLTEAPHAQLVVLGFSQGTATVVRWLARSGRRPARLILWAGSFPPDLEPAQARALLAGLPVTLVAGVADEYISAEQVAATQQQLSALGATVEVRTFDGGHVLDRETLLLLAEGFD